MAFLKMTSYTIQKLVEIIELFYGCSLKNVYTKLPNIQHHRSLKSTLKELLKKFNIIDYWRINTHIMQQQPSFTRKCGIGSYKRCCRNENFNQLALNETHILRKPINNTRTIEAFKTPGISLLHQRTSIYILRKIILLDKQHF